ncbi:swr1 complex component [Microbotryomycetes sp. JL201]|nr:swr1 complex component [Microbotryomycetes sp. JL201]
MARRNARRTSIRAKAADVDSASDAEDALAPDLDDVHSTEPASKRRRKSSPTAEMAVDVQDEAAAPKDAQDDALAAMGAARLKTMFGQLEAASHMFDDVLKQSDSDEYDPWAEYAPQTSTSAGAVLDDGRPWTSDNIQQWRNEQVSAKEAELVGIVDRHDNLVRELFHLDRFVTLIGFDPDVAKQDRSDVFLSFQREYDLYAAVADSDRSGRRSKRRGTKGAYDPATHTFVKHDEGKGKSKAIEMAYSPMYNAEIDLAEAIRKTIKATRDGILWDGVYRGPTPINLTPVYGTLADCSHLYKPPAPGTEVVPGPSSQQPRKLHGGPEDVVYTHPTQLPKLPNFDGSVAEMINSTYWIENDEEVAPPPPLSELEERAVWEADILVQADRLKSKGIQLHDPNVDKQSEPARAKDHADHIVEHALHFAKLVHDERKSHFVMARKMSKMIQTHFNEIKNKDEKLEREIKKNQKALARWTLREVRKKWKLALNVVKARRKAQQKEEQERLGKEQLDKMLNKSTNMLQAQQVEMAGESGSEIGSDIDDDDEEGEDETGEGEADLDEEEQDGDEEGEEEDVADSEQGSVIPDEGSQSLLDESSSSAISPSPSSPPPATRPSRRPYAPRKRSRLSISVTPADSADARSDGEGNGDGFGEKAFDEDDEERDEEDAAMEVDMEAEERDGDDDGSELGALAEEADMPIEELLRRSGYAAMMEAEAAGEFVAPKVEKEENDGEVDDTLGEEEEGSVAELVAGEDLDTKPDASELTAEEREAEAMSEFGSDKGEGLSDEDDKLAAEMEAEDRASESDDSEMAGLAEDADLPIEELMRKYGYGNEDEAIANAGVSSSNDNADTAPSSVVEEDEDEAGDRESSKADDNDDKHERISAEEDHPTDGAFEKVHLRPPFLLRGVLRPYQQAGLEWLASLYASGVNGILADEMGLGKTIQTIALLAHLACDKGQWGPHLVVVPTSVMLNWEMEFKKFLPGFKILTYYGSQKERKEKRRGWNTDNAFHVCITSYQLVLADQHMFRRKPWQYMILDEAHHIKNFRSQRWQTLLGFNSRFRLLLTGTPLQNNLMELWSLLYFLMPHGLLDGASGAFADHVDFQTWFSNPMERAIQADDVMDEETKATVAKLHTVLRPYLLRRLKSEVETQLPRKTESVIYCRLSKRQRFLYDEFMSRAQTRETLASGHFMSIINCLMQLRKVCNHPDLFEVRPIVTSFAMSKSVADGFEPTELLVRKRLLAEEPIAKIDWSTLTLVKSEIELGSSSIAADARIALDAGPVLVSTYSAPEGFNFAVQPPKDTVTITGWRKYHEWNQHATSIRRLESMARVNTLRCQKSKPFFGAELLSRLRSVTTDSHLRPLDLAPKSRESMVAPTILPAALKSVVSRARECDEMVGHFAFVTPKVTAATMPRHSLAGVSVEQVHELEAQAPADMLHRSAVKLSVAFPDRSLLQYDCGKLQKLDELLRECKAGGHRALIFTQMTKVLDILEEFLSFHGHRYLRLDGSTKIEQRQAITERFNSNDKILCFISSTRAGGLGINLQGADTVIFYDSDWNPALDRQCQDRAHRIGQTREVRIWRFVTEHTIEENMLKKANQKRRLDEVVIAEGDFTTDYLAKLDWRDYLDEQQREEFGVDKQIEELVPDDQTTNMNADGTTKTVQVTMANGQREPVVTQSAQEIRRALAAAEDEEDAAAARMAVAEMDIDRTDFNESGGTSGGVNSSKAGLGRVVDSESASATPRRGTPMDDEDDEEDDPLKGTIDGFMLKIAEQYYDDLS